MEEIVQELTEQGTFNRDLVGARHAVPLPTAIHIPPTVQAVLASRIDRLPPEEKDLLQTLAVVGKEFSLGLLKQVVDQSEDTLQQHLSRLRDAEFIYEQPAFPEPDYVFKHALTQEVAYNSLLVERRKVLHERAAQAIETIFHNRLDDQYSELASHYSRSGNTQKAVDYLQLAGQQAVQRSAYLEASNHFTAALDLLKTWPDSPARIHQELLLQISLGPTLIATKGYGSQEVENAYNRALELCQQVKGESQLFPSLLGLWVSHLIQARLQTARELGEQLLHLAQKVKDQSLLVGAHWALGESLLMLGEFRLAQEHLTLGITLYDPQKHRSQAILYGQDHGITCRCFAAWALWGLGYSDQALRYINEAITFARELSHLNSQAFALTCAAWLHQFLREVRPTEELAEALLVLSAEQGFLLWTAWGTIFQGWTLTEQGQKEEGIAQLTQGLAAYRATGAEVMRPHFLALLAEAQGKVGSIEASFATLTEAFATVDKNNDRFYEAELHRLKGELTLQQEKVKSEKSKVSSVPPPTPDPLSSAINAQAEAEAEACFLKALEISRKQQAKSLELRAAMSLARLWRQQGKRDEARQMLAEIYHWFTEGFDTKDLQEAKALIEELSHQAIEPLKSVAPQKNNVKKMPGRKATVKTTMRTKK
jgi:predicted ATPase